MIKAGQTGYSLREYGSYKQVDTRPPLFLNILKKCSFQVVFC